MMCSTIVTRVRNIPKTIAHTRIVLIEPTPGSVIISSRGLSQSAGMTSSNPKILPNMNPNIVEKIPAIEMIPARSLCFFL